MTRVLTNNGDNGRTTRDNLRYLTERVGTRPMIMATFGCSHMSGFFTMAHYLALSMYHDANILYDERAVFVGETDSATTLVAANARGYRYSVGASTPEHMVNTQLPQFLADVAAGFRADIGVSDGSLYNSQTDFATTCLRLHQMIDAFFDPNGNNGLYFIIYGTFGTNPTVVRSWANYWQQRADASNGRILFVDTASAVIDAKLTTSPNFATTQPTWANRGGSFNTLGSNFADGAHLGFRGGMSVAPLLAAAYRRACPQVFPRYPSYANANYDPVALPYGDLLGPGAGMVGTAGGDTYQGGAFINTLAGTGHGGASFFNNRWVSAYNGMSRPTYNIGTSPNGGFQQEMTAASEAAGSFARFNLQYAPLITNPNGGNPNRRYMAGCEIVVTNGSGCAPPYIDIAGNHMTPLSEGGGSDIMDDGATQVFKMRTLTPFAITADNPSLSFTVSVRTGATMTGTKVVFRDPFFRLVNRA